MTPQEARQFVQTYQRKNTNRSFASSVAPCPCCNRKNCLECDPGTRCGRCFKCEAKGHCLCKGGPQQADLFGFEPVDDGKSKGRDGKGYGS